MREETGSPASALGATQQAVQHQDDLRAAWFLAVEKGDLAAMARVFTQQPALVDTTMTTHEDRPLLRATVSALQTCVWRNDSAAVRWLLDVGGADTEISDEHGFTPLQLDIVRASLQQMRFQPLLRSRCLNVFLQNEATKYKRKAAKDRSRFGEIDTSIFEVLIKKLRRWIWLSQRVLMDLPLACPVCAAQFPAAGGAAFALHVADCTAPPSASSSSSFQAAVVDGVASASDAIHACAVCHHVYASGTAAHAVDFHEYECARANRRKGNSSSSKHQGKRPRESATAATNPPAADATPLFPPYCALCGAGGRGLLQCGGVCMRTFHGACIDEVQAGNSRAPSPAITGLGAAAWRCAECARGVHACAACGFLGHESNTLTKCTVASCGFFFHRAPPCRPSGDAAAGGVCPRHTCDVCGTVETDMRACESCTKCFAGAHVRCSSSKGETEKAAKSLGLRSGSANLRICGAHAAAAKPSSEQTLALKYRVQQGDLVLLLEFANAILPQGAKNAAPDAFNQWGIVTRAENVDGREQLLSVSVFSDGSVLSVPNKYVLPLGSANAFSTPQVMLRDCIKWHAVTELNLRHAELDALLAAAGDDDDADAKKKLEEARDHILNASCSAFYARAEKLGLSISQLFGAAKEGFTFWTTHRAELKTFEGSGAPIYVYMDTRAPPKSASGSKADAIDSKKPSTGEGDDVDMEDAAGGGEGSEGGSAMNASSSASSAFGRTFLRAGTNVSRRPTQQGEENEVVGAGPMQEDSSTLAASDSAMAQDDLGAVSTTVVVAAALSDLVASVEQDAAAARTPKSSGTSEEQMDVDDESVAQQSALAAAGITTEGATESSNKVVIVAESTMEMEEVDTVVKMAVTSVSPTFKTTTIVDAVEVTVVSRADSSSSSSGAESSEASAKVEFADKKEEPDADLERDAKRQKLAHLSSSQQSISVAVVKASATNTFVREKESYALQQTMAQKQTRTRKERVLSEYSPQLLQELARQAAVFLEEEANPLLAKRSRKSANPKHCDAFPFASATESFRPPYFRPSVVFNRGHGRRLDGLSRILLSQDKRNIKCFIQGTDENRCLHEPTVALGSRDTRVARSEGTFVTLDLMSVDSFRALEAVIRTRMIAAVEQDDRYLKEIFGARAALARRLFKEKRSGTLPVEIYYCSYDGSRSKVARGKDDWLCFCANVCHLTAVVPLGASLKQQ